MRRPLELALGPILLGVVAAALGSLAVFAIAVGLAMTYAGLHVAVAKATERLVIARHVEAQEVMEGSAVPVRFDLTGIGGLPVTVEVFCQCGQWHVLGRGSTALTWTFDRPGPYVAGPSPLRIRDDLGLFTRLLATGEPHELLVLPAPADTAPRARHGALDAAQDPEPDGLRTYVPGTPMSRIHWRSAARGGELQERTFAPASDALPLVVVDLTGARSHETVDWAARTAAGHVLALARGGGCRLLLPGDRKPTTLMDPVAHWPAVHRRLADLGRGAPAPGATRTGQREAVLVAATQAPPVAEEEERALPPGVRRTGAWAPA